VLSNPIRPRRGKGFFSSLLGELSRREREVLGLLSAGMTDPQIGDRLNLAASTVRNHIAALYAKIGVHSRGNAIVWARERGITNTALSSTKFNTKQ
jgi:DNA-binding CsgD family transcriptional regulator